MLWDVAAQRIGFVGVKLQVQSRTTIAYISSIEQKSTHIYARTPNYTHIFEIVVDSNEVNEVIYVKEMGCIVFFLFRFTFFSCFCIIQLPNDFFYFHLYFSALSLFANFISSAVLQASLITCASEAYIRRAY